MSLLLGEDEEFKQLKHQMESLEQVEGQKMGEEKLKQRLDELGEIREEVNQRAEISAISGFELDLSGEQAPDDNGIEPATNLERSMDEQEILRNLDDYDMKNYKHER